MSSKVYIFVFLAPNDEGVCPSTHDALTRTNPRLAAPTTSKEDVTQAVSQKPASRSDPKYISSKHPNFHNLVTLVPDRRINY
jgi:hypothetical protein